MAAGGCLILRVRQLSIVMEKVRGVKKQWSVVRGQCVLARDGAGLGFGSWPTFWDGAALVGTQ